MTVLYWALAILGYLAAMGIAAARTPDKRNVPLVAVLVTIIYAALMLGVYFLAGAVSGLGTLFFALCGVTACGFVFYGIFSLGKIRQINPAVLMLLLVFLLALAYVTLFSRERGSNSRVQMELFDFVTKYLRGRSAEYTTWHALENCMMMVPLGLLFPLLLRGGEPRWWTTTGFGLTVSMGIELTQLVTSSGICDVDDVIMNTLGTFLGYLVCRIFLLFTDRGRH